jgi:hypothetical protein
LPSFFVDKTCAIKTLRLMARGYGLGILGIFCVSGLSLWGGPGIGNEAAGEESQDGVVLLQRGVDAYLEPLDIFLFPKIAFLQYTARRDYATTDDPELAFYWKNERCDNFLEHLAEMRILIQGLTEEMDTLLELAQAVRDEPCDPTPQSQNRIRNAHQAVQGTHQRIDAQNAARLHQGRERYRAHLAARGN